MTTTRKQDRAITFLTQKEVQRLFDAIKIKRDRAIFAVGRYTQHSRDPMPPARLAGPGPTENW